MSCRKIEKPLISILMAVYKPNYIWLKEQLISLNNQTYDNLELIIYDDCPEQPLNEEIIKQYITKFQFKIIRGKVNLGSNKAFEKLTLLGKGQYFAYCDQDDIWEEDKIKILLNKIKSEKSTLAYSDMSVIDKDSKIMYETLLKAKPRIEYIYGDNILNKLFFKNCVSGCCMLVKSQIAKKAVPFCSDLVHDQWICVVASLYGYISFSKEKLVQYRIHENNQTKSLNGINSKEDYYNLKVNNLSSRLISLKNVLKKDKINKDINEIEEFCDARIKKNIRKIFIYRYLCKSEAYFEILIKYSPESFVKYLLKKLK